MTLLEENKISREEIDALENIALIANHPDLLNMLASFLRADNQCDKAIYFCTKIIEMEPGRIDAFLERGRTYLKKKDYDNALQDYTKVIEVDSETKHLKDAYIQRSFIFRLKEDIVQSDSDLSKVIELGVKESDIYTQLASLFEDIEEYKIAFEKYSYALSIDPENPNLYIHRARAYWMVNKGADALQDFAVALDLGLDKESVIHFLDGPLHKISNILLPGEDNADNFPSDFPLSTRLMELYDKIIRNYPELPEGYLHRGIYYMSTNEYEKAVHDFSAYLHFSSDDVFIIFLLGVCYDRLKDRGRSAECFQKIVQHSAIDNIKNIKMKLDKYPPIDNEIQYNLFLSVIGQISSIEETFLALFHLIGVNTLDWLMDKKDAKTQNILPIAKYLDNLIAASDTPSIEQEKIVNDIFYYYPDFSNTSSKTVLLRDGEADFRINVKLCIIEYMLSQTDIRDFGELYDSIPYAQANGNFYRFHEKDLNNYSNLMKVPIHFYKQLQYQLYEIKEKKLADEAKARIEERNKVIADLSHSIKNLIATVIDPLENMKQEKIGEPQIIRNALRGANLVREIVNAMNLSFKGSLKDFEYDAIHNQGKDSMTLDSLVVESIKYSVSNMFDGKYFSNFVHKYFPERDLFNEAKMAWRNISQTLNRQDVISFLEKYFFHIEISTGSGNQCSLGNETGSAIKLLILFQELIFNAVKYSASVEKKLRFLKINLTINHDHVTIGVTNRFRENLATKTSGIGRIIIDNFAKLLQTQPVVDQKDGIYSIEIKFINLWSEKNENSIH